MLCLHETASGAEIWRPLAGALDGRARVIAYDRRGWGASGAPEGYRATTVEEQAEDAAGLLEALELDRAVLCGAGLGAVIALDLVCRRPELVDAALLIEPPLLAFLPQATEGLSADRGTIEETVRDGGLGAAAQLYLSGGLPCLGPGAERIPAAIGEAAAARPLSLFAELAAVPGWTISTPALLAAEVPARVVLGATSPPLLRAAADELVARLGEAQLLRTGGSGLPHVDAPAELAAAVEDLLSPS